jgi:hypothetical protein
MLWYVKVIPLLLLTKLRIIQIITLEYNILHLKRNWTDRILIVCMNPDSLYDLKQMYSIFYNIVLRAVLMLMKRAVIMRMDSWRT